jgi:hypothetical protein
MVFGLSFTRRIQDYGVHKNVQDKNLRIVHKNVQDKPPHWFILVLLWIQILIRMYPH